MYKILIVVKYSSTVGAALTSQVVDFDTRELAEDAIAEIEAERRGTAFREYEVTRLY